MALFVVSFLGSQGVWLDDLFKLLLLCPTSFASLYFIFLFILRNLIISWFFNIVVNWAIYFVSKCLSFPSLFCNPWPFLHFLFYDQFLPSWNCILRRYLYEFYFCDLGVLKLCLRVWFCLEIVPCGRKVHIQLLG